MFKQIYTGNTVAFTVVPTIDGVEQPLEGTRIGFIVKKAKTDTDNEALIIAESESGQFALSAEQTDIGEGRYWYEIRWYALDAVYTLDMGTVIFTQTVYN